jgi:hypothetical protein
MADAVLVLSASPLTFPPEKLVCYCHLPKKFPHDSHSLWNNVNSSLAIRFGIVDRASSNAEAPQKITASRVRESQHTTKEVVSNGSFTVFHIV